MSVNQIIITPIYFRPLRALIELGTMGYWEKWLNEKVPRDRKLLRGTGKDELSKLSQRQEAYTLMIKQLWFHKESLCNIMWLLFFALHYCEKSWGNHCAKNWIIWGFIVQKFWWPKQCFFPRISVAYWEKGIMIKTIPRTVVLIDSVWK